VRALGIRAFFTDLLTGKSREAAFRQEMEAVYDSSEYQAISECIFDMNIGINMIANAIAKCEFQTRIRGKNVKKDEYYLWNYAPNKNESSTYFIKKMVSKLLKNNECLVYELAGQLFVADGYTMSDDVVREKVFSNVSTGSFSVNRVFGMSEVLYFKNNNENMTALLNGIINSYDTLVQTAYEKFYKSGGEKGILTIDAQKILGDAKLLGKTYEEIMDEMMNVRFKKFYNSRNAVLPLFNGYSYESNGAKESTKKSTSELKDFIDVNDEIKKKAAGALNIPYALYAGEIADIDALMDEFITITIEPLCDILQTEINRKRSGKEILNGTGLNIDTSSISYIDIFKNAEKSDKLISSGLYSINELRHKLNEPAIDSSIGDTHYITKNYDIMKEGDNGGQEKNDV
jgi:HK97 family phage portal protein